MAFGKAAFIAAKMLLLDSFEDSKYSLGCRAFISILFQGVRSTTKSNVYQLNRLSCRFLLYRVFSEPEKRCDCFCYRASFA